MMNKKRLYLICFIFLLVTIFTIVDSYGLFESDNTLSVDNNIARWNVLINGSDIKYNDTFVVDKVNLIDNENVQSGKIAPGSLGYFDIVIDPSDTDTAIRYDVTFDFSSLNNKVVVSSIEEVYSGNLIRTDLNTYSKVITLDDIKNNAVNTVRIYIKWDNNEEDNDTDSEIGSIINNHISIPVTVSASQYLGEDIPLYTAS